MFADWGYKINSKGKADYRVLVVTDKNIYKQDPKNYKVKKYENALSNVQAITVSPFKDQYCIVHAKETNRDLVVDIGLSKEERLSEFVTVIVQQIKNLTGTTIPVNFADTVKYNNSRTPKKAGIVQTLTFQSSTIPELDNPQKTLSGALFKPGKPSNVVLFKQ